MSQTPGSANGLDELVTGNYFDKYASRNPIVRRLMQRFTSAFDRLVQQSGAAQAHEVGCGEGYLSERLLEAGLRVTGTEISPEVLAQARQRLEGHENLVRLASANVYDLDPATDAAELIVCCEVMEHLPDPEQALDILATLARPCLLVSVPWEPWWRILNVCRGKYLGALGNTPGHLQHWTKRSFRRFIEAHFDIVAEEPVFPWIMLLARRRG